MAKTPHYKRFSLRIGLILPVLYGFRFELAAEAAAGTPRPWNNAYESTVSQAMKFLLWCILLVLSWPIALAALVVYPLVWLLLLPFRVVGIAVGGVLQLVWAIVTLPARLLGVRSGRG